MYSRDQIETFRTILKPLCDTGTIPPELFAVALKAVREKHLLSHEDRSVLFPGKKSLNDSASVRERLTAIVNMDC